MASTVWHLRGLRSVGRASGEPRFDVSPRRLSRASYRVTSSPRVSVRASRRVLVVARRELPCRVISIPP